MAIITVPILIGTAIGATGVGAWLGSQADDAIEVVTGEKDSFPILQIILLLVVAFLLWRAAQRFAS